MTNVTPDLFAEGCDHELPAWGVTRQFDFGQFVILYDERIVDGKRTVTPIVLSNEGDIVVPDAPAAASGQSKNGKAKLPQPATTATGGVPIQLLYESEKAIELVTSVEPKPVPVASITDFLSKEEVKVGDTTYRAKFPLDARLLLASGEPVTVVGRSWKEDGEEQRELLRFTPSVKEEMFTSGELNRLLATGKMDVGGQELETHLSASAVHSLLEGRDVVVAARADGDDHRLVRVKPPQPVGRPVGTRFRIRDLAGFVAAPAVPGTHAQSIPVDLDAEAVKDLRDDGRATVRAGGVDVELVVERDGPPWGMPSMAGAGPMGGIGMVPGFAPGGFGTVELTPAGPGEGEGIERLPGSSGVGGITVMPERGGFPGLTPDPDDPGGGVPGGGWPGGGPPGAPGHTVGGGGGWPVGKTIQMMEIPFGALPLRPNEEPRAGLQLAILLPWRQEWKLDGFSRGSLLSSIALAPLEETTITVSSWERRAKALEQSTETEVEQLVDFTQTTRDTDDVFREMTNRHDFQWQLHGNLDASYSNGVASVRVGVDGGVDSTDSVSNVLRTTHNHLYEVTSRASTRVRTKRVTKISESVDRGFAQDVVRRIRNTNECHTLTLDFHEVLAHYTIDTTFLPGRVRVVVLVPNPISTKAFTELLVRKNETALRDALLDRALADGFEACRVLKSYRNAEDELRRLAAESKQIEELSKERVKDTTNKVEKPKNPHEDKVIAAIKEIAAAAKSLVNAQMSPALDSIGSHTMVTSDERTNCQRRLFLNLCQAKINPSFVTTLQHLANAGQLGIADAQRFLDSLPRPEAFPQLATLNDLPDTDKEQAGAEASLETQIKTRHGYDFTDWPWWTGRCREERLYLPDDAGIVAMADRLRKTWQDYETKAAEGDGILAGNQLKEGAEEKQAQASFLDKLEMKYGLEVVASAKERAEALLAHLNDHMDYYRYVLFQALPPGEQLSRLMEAAPQLRVGMFEPHVVAMNGPFLAVPLSPLGETKLANTLTSLQKVLKTASQDAAETAEEMGDNQVILPTPGISVESWLGRCNGCDQHLRNLRSSAARQAAASSRLSELEGDRRQAMLDAGQLGDPSPAPAPVLRVDVERPEDK